MNNSQFSNSFSFPTQVKFGPGVLSELPSYLLEHNLQRIFIVTDASIRSQDFFNKTLTLLSSSGIQYELFSEIHTNPLKSDVVLGTDKFHKTDSQALIGMGGGAAMDTARSIGLAVNHRRDLFDYCEDCGGDRLITSEIPPLIAIPTTAGTGSEVGRSAVISDDKTKEKRILFHPSLMASQVFCDPEVTRSLPAPIAAATGMDALTHHIEAYLSKGFHPLCDALALEGVYLANQYLEQAVLEKDLESRSQMMACALMGATAFQKGLGLIHSMAHALSAHKDMHHGLANAILLPYGLKYNLSHCEDKFRRLAHVVGIMDYSPGDFIQRIEEIRHRIGIPENLGEHGIDNEDCKVLSQLAFQDVCHQSNPVPVSEEGFFELFRSAL